MCWCVVWNPKQCQSKSNCLKLYCSACIEPWLAKNKTCPNCRSESQFSKIDRFVASILNELTFTCDKLDCKDPNYKYVDALKHVKVC